MEPSWVIILGFVEVLIFFGWKSGTLRGGGSGTFVGNDLGEEKSSLFKVELDGERQTQAFSGSYSNVARQMEHRNVFRNLLQRLRCYKNISVVQYSRDRIDVIAASFIHVLRGTVACG